MRGALEDSATGKRMRRTASIVVFITNNRISRGVQKRFTPVVLLWRGDIALLLR